MIIVRLHNFKQVISKNISCFGNQLSDPPSFDYKLLFDEELIL